MEKGTLSGNPITGVRFVLKDGAFHAVDSSELAFRLAAIGAFREAFKQAAGIILEPVMTVEVVAPSEFQSTFLSYPSCLVRVEPWGGTYADKICLQARSLVD